MPIIDKQVMDLLRAVKARVGPDFTGVGLIFYHAPLTLPVVPLRASDSCPAKLPLNKARVPELLAEISRAENPWHDGFHFLECESHQITHLAQFVSPPLAPFRGTLPSRGGARHMTAALSSLAQRICCVALLTADGRASIYRQGQCTADETLE